LALKNGIVGRPKGGVLEEEQSERLRILLVDQTPEHNCLSGQLWNIELLRDLISKTEGIQLSSLTVNRTLKRWGFSVFNSPCSEMLNTEPGIFNQWLADEYPAIYKSAKKERALIWWGGVAGIINHDEIETQNIINWGQTKQNPVILINGEPYSLYTIYAISNTGNLFFYISKIHLNTNIVTFFLDNLQKLLLRNIYFIISNNDFIKINDVDFKDINSNIKIFYI